MSVELEKLLGQSIQDYKMIDQVLGNLYNMIKYVSIWFKLI